MMMGASSAPATAPALSVTRTCYQFNAYHRFTEEAVDALNIKPSGTYIDGTFGRGGHSKKILSKLGKTGRLFAMDRDLAALEAGKQIKDARFQNRASAFFRNQSIGKR